MKKLILTLLLFSSVNAEIRTTDKIKNVEYEDNNIKIGKTLEKEYQIITDSTIITYSKLTTTDLITAENTYEWVEDPNYVFSGAQNGLFPYTIRIEKLDSSNIKHLEKKGINATHKTTIKRR